jgi:WD40 repeat protein
MTAAPELREGKSWQFGAFVGACDFAEDDRCTFSVGDGTLRFVDAGAEPKEIKVHDGACLSFTPAPDGGYLSGGDDGRLVLVDGAGSQKELTRTKGKWIDQLAVGETGLIAFAAGKDAFIVDGETHTKFSHASTVGGLAFDPKGRRLAVAHYDGVSLWWAKAAAQEPKQLKWKGSHLGATFSPDGRFLVTTMQENALHGWRLEDAADMRMTGYPAKVKSWSWDRRGKFLYTSGASRVIAWSFTGRTGPMGKEPMEFGPQRDAIVTAVAAHPLIDSVAAGMSDGAVWVQNLEDQGASYVALKGAPISALAFSSDGTSLAIGAEDGFAAIVPL